MYVCVFVNAITVGQLSFPPVKQQTFIVLPVYMYIYFTRVLSQFELFHHDSFALSILVIFNHLVCECASFSRVLQINCLTLQF